MPEKITFSPNQDNLGLDCRFWNNGCEYPKFEMKGRTSCEGIIDPVCIYLKEGRRVEGFDLTDDQVRIIKTNMPGDPQAIPASRPLDLNNPES